jgi:hypothetical protein
MSSTSQGSSLDLAGPRAGHFSRRTRAESGMAIAALLYAMIGLVAGAIGLLAATSAPLQIRPTVDGNIVTSQYCVPPTDGVDLHKVYCHHERG